MASKNKLLILLITTTIAIPAFVVNTWFNWQLYKVNLKVVPEWQADPVLGSNGFLVVMNIVSNVFNPIVCAGYIMAFYLLSHRRFQILVFLVWFIFLSVFLTFMKSLIQQARPYWMTITDVKMLEWTCYTEFGCPSGHSMLGLILIQFILRYYTRSRSLSFIMKVLLISLGVILQSMVVFSRVILGMHSLNQVLFGVMLGFYSLIPYYMYMQKFILNICLKMCSKTYRRRTILTSIVGILLMIGLSLTVAFVPAYGNNQDYFNRIKSTEGCENAEIYQSFQYKCLQDSSLAMAVFGVSLGLCFLRNQQRLMKVIKYPRASKKYILRLILSALIATIPVAIFMNPFWKKIEMPDSQKATMLFFLQGAGLFFGNFVLVGLAPVILSKLRLEDYFSHDEARHLLTYRQKQLMESKRLNSQSQLSQKINQSKQIPYDTVSKNNSIAIPVARQQQQ